jgi:hypothetical protein
VARDEVAASIGLDPPLLDLTNDAREFVNTAMVLKHKRYIRGPVNYEWVQLTNEGIRACEEVPQRDRGIVASIPRFRR